MVWIDHEGVWDATLGKESLSTSGNFDTSIYRIQLLFNVEKKTYYTHIRRDQCESKKRCDREGEGDLQSAQVAFRNCFEEATGLPWNFRDNDPHERRYIFVACRYEDGAGDGSSQAQQSETASSALVLKPSVRNVLEMLFDPKQKSEIQNLIATLSTGRLKVNRTAVTEHTVRVGTALLDELCKLPCNSRGEVKGGHGKLAERLKRCYWGLMFTNANSEPTDTTWIQQEREALCFLRNLIWLQAVLKGTSKLVGQELLLTAHQQLRFPEMTPCTLHIFLCSASRQLN